MPAGTNHICTEELNCHSATCHSHSCSQRRLISAYRTFFLCRQDKCAGGSNFSCINNARGRMCAEC